MFWVWFGLGVFLVSIFAALLSDPWDFEDFIRAFLLASVCTAAIGIIGVVVFRAAEGASAQQPPIEAPGADEVIKVEEEVSPAVAVPTLTYDFGEAAGCGNQEILTRKFGGEK